MSLVDDQILNDSQNALDELSKRINREKNPMKAAEAVLSFEDGMAKAKNEKTVEAKPGKTIINPEELLREIQEDMAR